MSFKKTTLRPSGWWKGFTDKALSPRGHLVQLSISWFLAAVAFSFALVVLLVGCHTSGYPGRNLAMVTVDMGAWADITATCFSFGATNSTCDDSTSTATATATATASGGTITAAPTLTTTTAGSNARRGKIWSAIENGYSDVKSKAGSAASAIKSDAEGGASAVESGFEGAVTEARSAVSALETKAASIADEVEDDFTEVGDVVKELFAKIIDKVESKFNSWLQEMAKLLNDGLGISQGYSLDVTAWCKDEGTTTAANWTCSQYLSGPKVDFNATSNDGTLLNFKPYVVISEVLGYFFIPASIYEVFRSPINSVADALQHMIETVRADAAAFIKDLLFGWLVAVFSIASFCVGLEFVFLGVHWVRALRRVRSGLNEKSTSSDRWPQRVLSWMEKWHRRLHVRRVTLLFALASLLAGCAILGVVGRVVEAVHHAAEKFGITVSAGGALKDLTWTAFSLVLANVVMELIWGRPCRRRRDADACHATTACQGLELFETAAPYGGEQKVQDGSRVSQDSEKRLAMGNGRESEDRPQSDIYEQYLENGQPIAQGQGSENMPQSGYNKEGY